MSSLNYSLIFGATGQDGALMASSLLKSCKGVIGVSRSKEPNLKNLNSLKNQYNSKSTLRLINKSKVKINEITFIEKIKIKIKGVNSLNPGL